MFGWLQFWRPRPAKGAETAIVDPDQVDLPTPELRELFANYVNSGKAVFGVYDGKPSAIVTLNTGEFDVGAMQAQAPPGLGEEPPGPA